MSNIFLSTSLIYLAREEAGCIDEEGEVIEDCDGTAYGFQPASFVSNIAVISSLLSAFFMPLVGAMVDYTEYRKRVGAIISASIVAIQIAQIGTVSETWFVMAILQALAGFLYQGLVLSVYAYLPDMSYRVGETTMTKCKLQKVLQSQCQEKTTLM
jgi:MFS-type transporter involved in bile tolerance (Atg22 family)